MNLYGLHDQLDAAAIEHQDRGYSRVAGYLLIAAAALLTAADELATEERFIEDFKTPLGEKQ